MQRCDWPKSDLSIQYHDEEWGVPIHEEHRLFEHLILGGAQAGLSWETILSKRENYRNAYDHFAPAKVARYNAPRIERLLKNPGIVRNRLKVVSSVKNAKAFLQVHEEFGSFDLYLWRFVDGKPVKNSWKTMNELPARTLISDTLSKDLLGRGFKFVGSTICYAFMQAVGMVNDHTINCFRYQQV